MPPGGEQPGGDLSYSEENIDPLESDSQLGNTDINLRPRGNMILDFGKELKASPKKGNAKPISLQKEDSVLSPTWHLPGPNCQCASCRKTAEIARARVLERTKQQDPQLLKEKELEMEITDMFMPGRHGKSPVRHAFGQRLGRKPKANSGRRSPPSSNIKMKKKPGSSDVEVVRAYAERLAAEMLTGVEVSLIGEVKRKIDSMILNYITDLGDAASPATSEYGLGMLASPESKKKAAMRAPPTPTSPLSVKASTKRRLAVDGSSGSPAAVGDKPKSTPPPPVFVRKSSGLGLAFAKPTQIKENSPSGAVVSPKISSPSPRPLATTRQSSSPRLTRKGLTRRVGSVEIPPPGSPLKSSLQSSKEQEEPAPAVVSTAFGVDPTRFIPDQSPAFKRFTNVSSKPKGPEYDHFLGNDMAPRGLRYSKAGSKSQLLKSASGRIVTVKQMYAEGRSKLASGQVHQVNVENKQPASSLAEVGMQPKPQRRSVPRSQESTSAASEPKAVETAEEKGGQEEVETVQHGVEVAVSPTKPVRFEIKADPSEMRTLSESQAGADAQLDFPQVSEPALPMAPVPSQPARPQRKQNINNIMQDVKKAIDREFEKEGPRAMPVTESLNAERLVHRVDRVPAKGSPGQAKNRQRNARALASSNGGSLLSNSGSVADDEFLGPSRREQRGSRKRPGKNTPLSKKAQEQELRKKIQSGAEKAVYSGQRDSTDMSDIATLSELDKELTREIQDLPKKIRPAKPKYDPKKDGRRMGYSEADQLLALNKKDMPLKSAQTWKAPPGAEPIKDPTYVGSYAKDLVSKKEAKKKFEDLEKKRQQQQEWQAKLESKVRSEVLRQKEEEKRVLSEKMLVSSGLRTRDRMTSLQNIDVSAAVKPAPAKPKPKLVRKKVNAYGYPEEIPVETPEEKEQRLRHAREERRRKRGKETDVDPFYDFLRALPSGSGKVGSHLDGGLPYYHPMAAAAAKKGDGSMQHIQKRKSTSRMTDSSEAARSAYGSRGQLKPRPKSSPNAAVIAPPPNPEPVSGREARRIVREWEAAHVVTAASASSPSRGRGAARGGVGGGPPGARASPSRAGAGRRPAAAQPQFASSRPMLNRPAEEKKPRGRPVDGSKNDGPPRRKGASPMQRSDSFLSFDAQEEEIYKDLESIDTQLHEQSMEIEQTKELRKSLSRVLSVNAQQQMQKDWLSSEQQHRDVLPQQPDPLDVQRSHDLDMLQGQARELELLGANSDAAGAFAGEHAPLMRSPLSRSISALEADQSGGDVT